MSSKRIVALVGHVTTAEVVKRTWIVTIVGEETGSAPHAIKQGIFNVVMELAPKIPGARTVTVGLSRKGQGPGSRIANRDRVHQRKVASAAPSRKPRRKPVTPAGTLRKIDPAKHVTWNQAQEIYNNSNGKLLPSEKIVLSHLMGWGTAKMDRRSVARQFSLGGEAGVRRIAKEAWNKLGLVRIKAGFEQVT